MNNEELKKKIVEVIDNWADNAVKTKRSGASVYDPYNAAELADALIAAGIGDVTEWKERAKKHRVRVLPDGTIKQLYSDEEVEDIARQRDEYKHRAEVAELVVNNLNDTFTFDYQYVFEQAEKELQEESKDE